MTVVIHALVNFPSDTGLPEDVVCNNLYFKGPNDGTGGDIDLIHPLIEDFWTTIPTGGTARPDSYLSAALGTTVTVKYYNLDDPTPRAPIDERTFTITPDAEANLPTEVATVLSFSGTPLSGTPMARRRGRNFIGPLSDDVVTLDGARVVATEVFCEDLGFAAIDLVNDSQADGVDWVVYSPTTRGASPDSIDGAVDVRLGWVDNAFDTMRSRGTIATQRYEWTTL